MVLPWEIHPEIKLLSKPHSEVDLNLRNFCSGVSYWIRVVICGGSGFDQLTIVHGWAHGRIRWNFVERSAYLNNLPKRYQVLRFYKVYWYSGLFSPIPSSCSWEYLSLTSCWDNLDFLLFNLHSRNSKRTADTRPRQIIPSEVPYPVGYFGPSLSRKTLVPMRPNTH